MMRGYAPYKQTLEDLRDQLESFLLTSINRYTHGSMMVLNDQYKTVRLGQGHIGWITDDVMGVLFDKLTPFSANFIKLNDYSLRVQSLSALRGALSEIRLLLFRGGSALLKGNDPPHLSPGKVPGLAQGLNFPPKTCIVKIQRRRHPPF
ncbi:MAG: hypothetical protein ACLUE8_14630 [Lachnospiraceae bacterium]